MFAPLGAYCEMAAANHEVSTKKCSCVCVSVCLSVCVCVSVTQMMSTIIHPSPIIRHPAAHHLHLTQHPRQKVRRVNNAVLGIANLSMNREHIMRDDE